jgi:hypothetical protein
MKQYEYLYAYCLANNIKDGMIFNMLMQAQSNLTEDMLPNATAQGEAIYKQCCAR